MKSKALVSLTGMISLAIAAFAFAPAANAHDWHGRDAHREVRHEIRFAHTEVVSDCCHPSIVQRVLDVL